MKSVSAFVKVSIASSIILGTIGLIFFVQSASFIVDYINAPETDHRSEYLQGFVLSLILSTPFWIGVSLFSLSFRRITPKPIYIIINTPTAALLTYILASTIIPLFLYAIE